MLFINLLFEYKNVLVKISIVQQKNKDGTIDKNDLRGAFDNVGVLMNESELDGLLSEISGPCTFDNMIKMFQSKMAGGKFRFEHQL